MNFLCHGLTRIYTDLLGQNRFPFHEHSKYPIACASRCEVLQGVSANNVADRKYLAVGFLENFRKDVESDDHCKVEAARISRRKEQCQQQDQDGIDLHCGVDAQIALSAQFTGAPVENAGNAKTFEHGEESKSYAHSDALGDDGREQRHEDDHDRNAIPYEAGIVGSKVIVARAERGEDERREHHKVKPALSTIREFDGARTEERNESPDSDDCEWEVRNDVAEVWNSEPGAVVGEVVIRERLGDWREEKGNDCDDDRSDD